MIDAMRILDRSLLCAALALTVIAPVLAADNKPSAPNAKAAAPGRCLPQWQGGWVRLPPSASMPMAAGFGQFDNACPQALAVVAASSPAFGDVSLHESFQADGVNRMREVARLPLPAAGKVTLAPGGLHLMLMEPKQALAEGGSVPVRFTLEDGRTVEATLQVRKTAP
jgi:copper(I)-binding protein